MVVFLIVRVRFTTWGPKGKPFHGQSIVLRQNLKGLFVGMSMKDMPIGLPEESWPDLTENNMPYKIKGDEVVKKDGGKVVGHSKKPKKYLHTLEAVEHGWKPNHAKSKALEAKKK